jgi:hypothetical protein
VLIADGNVVLPVVIGIACVIVLGVGALYLFRGYERLARRSLERRYAGLQLHEAPVSGDVIVTYHTYHGFIAWFTQIPHEVALPPNDARKLLGRLLRFNLMWGLVTYGALFIPPLSIISYFAQRRSIDEQEAGGGVAVGAGTDIPLEEVATSERVSNEDGVAAPSLFHRVVGWTAAFLCGVFVINAVVCLLRAEFGIAIGSTVFALLVRWAARDWLGKGRRSMT